MTILFFISHTILQFLHAIIHVIILLFHSILNQFHCLSFAYVVLTFDTPFPFILTFIHLLPPYVKRSLTPFIIQFFLIIYPQFRFPTVPLQFVN